MLIQVDSTNVVFTLKIRLFCIKLLIMSIFLCYLLISIKLLLSNELIQKVLNPRNAKEHYY